MIELSLFRLTYKGTEYPAKRRELRPEAPELFVAGQNVDVKFYRKWYPAVMVTPWEPRKTKKKKEVGAHFRILTFFL